MSLWFIIILGPGGCKREVPAADTAADGPAVMARAEKAERELANALEALQQARQDRELEALVDELAAQVAALTAEPNETDVQQVN